MDVKRRDNDLPLTTDGLPRRAVAQNGTASHELTDPPDKVATGPETPLFWADGSWFR